MTNNNTYEARDLWASQGVPYYEPDKVEARSVIRTVYNATRLKSEFGMTADAEVVSP